LKFCKTTTTTTTLLAMKLILKRSVVPNQIHDSTNFSWRKNPQAIWQNCRVPLIFPSAKPEMPVQIAIFLKILLLSIRLVIFLKKYFENFSAKGFYFLLFFFCEELFVKDSPIQTKQTKPLMMQFFGQEFLELWYNVQQGKDEVVSNGFYLSN